MLLFRRQEIDLKFYSTRIRRPIRSRSWRIAVDWLWSWSLDYPGSVDFVCSDRSKTRALHSRHPASNVCVIHLSRRITRARSNRNHSTWSFLTGNRESRRISNGTGSLIISREGISIISISHCSFRKWAPRSDGSIGMFSCFSFWGRTLIAVTSVESPRSRLIMYSGVHYSICLFRWNDTGRRPLGVRHSSFYLALPSTLRSHNDVSLLSFFPRTVISGGQRVHLNMLSSSARNER